MGIARKYLDPRDPILVGADFMVLVATDIS